MTGTVAHAPGVLFSGDNYKAVKKVLKKGEKIAKHNHRGAMILFSIISGDVRVLLNETEEHMLTQGTVLEFDGENFIQAEILSDAEILIVPITKR